MSRMLDYARLVRLPNVFTALADICLGFFVTLNVGEAGSLPRFGLLLLSSACLYCGGMVWNDYFDVEQDRKERPFRPLASGRIRLGTAFWLGCFLLAAGVGLALGADFLRPALGFQSVVLAGCLTAAILIYDGVFKPTWAGPIFMGLCRFLNVLLGLSIVSFSNQEHAHRWAEIAPPSWGWLLAVVVGLYVTGVTWFARTEAQQRSNMAAAHRRHGHHARRRAAGLAGPGLASAECRVGCDRGGCVVPVSAGRVHRHDRLGPGRAIARPVPERVQAAVNARARPVLLDAVLATSIVGWIGLSIGLLRGR